MISDRFFEVAKLLPPYEQMLLSVPRKIADKATEIRIRAGRPVVIECINERFICGTRCADINEIYNCVKYFCNFSIHSCQREFSEGWITLKGGHRAGFSGTAYLRDGKLETIKDISYLNVRISREHRGISDFLFGIMNNTTNTNGLLIAGPPLSGKTTFLRDYCRNCGNSTKTALIDERGEIAAVYNGVPQNDVGFNTDVLNGYTKRDGIEQALRVLSPEFVICDEISEEADIIGNFACCGVRFVISVHCADLNEACNNKTINNLIKSKAINSIAFLEGKKNTGNLKGLWVLNDGKGIDSCCNGNNLLYNRYDSIDDFENAGSTAKKAYNYAG